MARGVARGLVRHVRTHVLAAAAVVLVASMPGGTVHADPAGPTDYRSEILSIEPPTPSIELDVLGGDSFVELTVEPGTEVTVSGYRGEEYLWFRADGAVLENRNSPTTYQNEDRYGGEAPAFATPDAEPAWKEVGSNGRWAWHDHRAHWMQSIRPAGKGPGDRVVEAVIPLVVDGAPVAVTVISTWQPAASSLPMWLGSLAGALLALAGWAMWRRSAPWAVVALPVTGVALVVGVWQFRSLPAETGPRLAWWLLPAVAVAAASVAVVAARRRASFVATAAVLLAAAQIVTWGFVKRDGLTAAIVPGDAPGWLDRLATSSALVGGASIAALALWELFGPRRDVSGGN